MKFKHGTRRRALQYEKDWVQRWKENKTFEKSVENRPKADSYVFYDGPPFITGVPHHGTLLTSIVKDVVPRYQTMKGKRVERVWGWDTHGLPAEVFTEKKLGVNDRRDIGTKISLEDYITTARDNMVQTGSLWEDTIDRIGRWVDFKGAYKTMDRDYMESVWWAFKELYEKGKIYEGEKVLMYCTRDATPLSKAEVTMDAGAYQDVTDPSVYVKFKLNVESAKKLADVSKLQLPEARANILAWTTTPWTLPANTALAVNENLIYAVVKIDNELFIVAQELTEKVFVDEKHQPLPIEVLGALEGKHLVGLTYEPLFENRGDGAHRIWAADYVSHEDGTGIVHIAPAYGEEDFALAREQGIPVVHTIDENGYFTEGDWKGANVWEANKQIAKDLKERGMVWKIDYIRHSYPHCHRCGTKLMYRAHPSWFMDIEGQRTEMLEGNSQVNWFPEHIKHGRSEKTIQTAPDWNLSRDRFWATAMPVWEGFDSEGVKHQKVIGSYAELKELSGVELEDYHRPWIDSVEFDLDGVHYKRIDKVIDCWFESGSMPFAQFHYPFENKEKFEANFPGDFIVEYVPQVRAWFYYMSAVNVGLFGQVPFKTALVHGTLAGNDGRKMSKSYGNYTDPNELMDKFSADSLRFLLLSSPVLNGEDFSLQDKDVGDVARKLSMIWNMYDFFTMYAEVDEFTFPYPAASSDAFLVHGMSNTAHSDTPDSLHDNGTENSFPIIVDVRKLTNPLDIWIVSRLHELNRHVTKHMDSYNIPDAMADILPFLDDASNWYVRRSRRRFWKSEDDGDKADAYRTLHYVLLKLSVILAPFTPFLAEELYHNLGGGAESVHLLDWPADYTADQTVIDDMARTRELINAGLSLRMKKDENQDSIKVRQPLQFASYAGEKLDGYYEQIIAEELNVKEVRHIGSLSDHLADYDQITGNINETMWIEVDKRLTPELKREGLMREVVRFVQAARKSAGLNVDDRIVLGLTTDDTELGKAIETHKATIEAEALAIIVAELPDALYTETVAVEKTMPLTIHLKK